MDNNRRALYNSLRMNWILDPTLAVEPWQVENYRIMPLDVIFERLEKYNIYLDKESFLIFSENIDAPENLTDAFLSDVPPDTKTQDQIYLLIFELWRRLLPERPCLSIFCDEIDEQIHKYDRDQTKNNNVINEALQDALANLQILLEENTDAGSDPSEAFECIDAACANDLESFLLDYIADQIDLGNHSYATELIDGFSDYVHHFKWFELLKANVLASTDLEEANLIVHQLINEPETDTDLEFILEILSFLVRNGDEETFKHLVKRATKIIKTEDDFQTLLAICADFYHRLDKNQTANTLEHILDKRESFDLNKCFNKQDPQFIDFSKILTIT